MMEVMLHLMMIMDVMLHLMNDDEVMLHLNELMSKESPRFKREEEEENENKRKHKLFCISLTRASTAILRPALRSLIKYYLF